MSMTSQFASMTSSSNFFDVILFLLSSLVAGQSFTASGVTTVYFYEGLTRNLEIGNTPLWVLPNIWRQVSYRYQIGTNVPNEILLNAAKYQVTAFTVFELLIGNQQGGVKLPPTYTRVKKKYVTIGEHSMLFSNNNQPVNKNKIDYWHRPKKNIKIPCITLISLQNFWSLTAHSLFNQVQWKRNTFRKVLPCAVCCCANPLSGHVLKHNLGALKHFWTNY